MLRPDVKYMLEIDYEPKIPDINTIKKQFTDLACSARIYRGLVSIGTGLQAKKFPNSKEKEDK